MGWGIAWSRLVRYLLAGLRLVAGAETKAACPKRINAGYLDDRGPPVECNRLSPVSHCRRVDELTARGPG